MTAPGQLSLGIDLGTGSTKAVLLGPDGTELGVASAPVRLSNPKAGWAEADAQDWWGSVRSAVTEVTGDAGGDVACIGLSGQMHGVILARADGGAVRPAILWLDGRAGGALGAYQALPRPAARRLGNPFIPGMAGPILHWLAHHEPGHLQEADYALQAKDWLRLRLTGGAGAEPSDASGTLLYDIFDNTWDEEVAEGLGVPARLLAPISPSGALAGPLGSGPAADLGLRPGLPVAYGGADTAAALIGSGLVDVGPVQLTVGTGAQVVALRRQPAPDDRLRYHVFASAVPSQWYALAAVQAAGVAFNWALEVFGLDWDQAYQLLDARPGRRGGPLFVPHLAGARSPSMDFTAQGGFYGAQVAHDRADMVRAVFEGVAFSILEAAAALPEFAADEAVYLAGGGSTRPEWRQLLSDVLGKPVLVLGTTNASAKGAALLGALAAGLVGEARGDLRVVGEVTPQAGPARRLARTYERWREAAAIRLQPEVDDEGQL